MATKHPSSDKRTGLVFETLESPQNDRDESTFLIDLRRQPRFDANLPGEAFSESGEHGPVRITNISLSGLRLEGSRQTVGALFANPNRLTQDTDSHISLQVHFSVPTDSDLLVPVKVHCRTVYTRRASEDTYQVGVKFETFEEGRVALAEHLTYRGTTRKTDR